MSEAMRANVGSEAVAWHAVPAEEVVGRLHTDPATGLDAAEGIAAAFPIRPQPPAGGESARADRAVPRPSQQHPRLRACWVAGFVKLAKPISTATASSSRS